MPARAISFSGHREGFREQHRHLQRRTRTIRLHPGERNRRISPWSGTIVGNRLFLAGHRVVLPTSEVFQTDSEVFVAQNGQFVGTLVVADMLRPEETKAIRDLKSMGLKAVLLTGDSKIVAEDIGRKLGVDEIAAELLPEDKLEFMGRLTKARHNVVMVGDGVNDAPALMKAT